MSQTANLEWRDGMVPVSTRFDDPYYSLDNGLAETRHVFLDGNGLITRLRDGFHVAELGFGTGLNLLASLRLWRDTGQAGRLLFTSFEAFPISVQDMRAAHSAFPELAAESTAVLEGLNTGRMVDLPDLRFELIVGDARETVACWPGQADAWFLDGFSPAKNPELWGVELMQAVAHHTAQGGTVATYTAAGHVRRALQSAGFEVVRRPGFGRKRHMTTASMP